MHPKKELCILWTPVCLLHFLRYAPYVYMHNSSKKMKLLARTAEEPWAPTIRRGTVCNNKNHWFVCLFVCLFVWGLTFNSTIFHSFGHLCRWRAANFDLCSALMAIEQWGFFSVSHLLWHGSSVYNGHLRGPMTPACGANALPLRQGGQVCWKFWLNKRIVLEKMTKSCQ